MYILHFVARIVALFSRLGQASNSEFFFLEPLSARYPLKAREK